MKVLIAEDDENMRKILKLYLEKAGWSVDTVPDGETALTYFEINRADLLLLDWMMPKKSGIEVCREIRQMNIPVKIIMLTAKTMAASELQGLTAGADDYIRKPFDIQVLLVRIKKLCNIQSQLTCGELSLNPVTFEAARNGEKIELTKKEYELLKYFLQNRNIVLSRDQILNQVWGMDYGGESRTVDTHIRRLRKKIGDSYIQTCFGTGYLMEDSYE